MATSNIKAIIQSDIHKVWGIVLEKATGAVRYGFKENTCSLTSVLRISHLYGNYPCHRVVNHAGRLAPGWYEQGALLEDEGIILKDETHVDLKCYQWDC